MAERTRVLTIGGALLGLVVIGLIVGFLALGDANDSPDGLSSPSPTPTDVKTQVEQAYLRYWDVYADAFLRLDSGRLDEVLTGEALANVRRQLQEQRTKNEPVRIRIEHDHRILIVDETTASVEDDYVNHSVRLDPETNMPKEEDPNERVRRTYTMKKVDGVWKVANIIGFRSGSS